MDRPTKAAYEAACKALWKHREGEEKLEAANKVLVEKNRLLRNEIRLLKKRAKRQEAVRSRNL